MAAAYLPSVITFPISILRKSQMKLKQKLAVAVFLSLSLVTIMASITRYAGYQVRVDSIDATWMICLVYLKASIPIIMASTAAFRTLLTRGGPDPGEIKKRHKLHNLYLIRKRFLRTTDWEVRDREHLPKIPSATLTGMDSFIYNIGRSGDMTTLIRLQDTCSMNEEQSQESSPGISQNSIKSIARG